MKLEIQPYLTFNGDCEDAFNFYKSVFGTEFDYFGRFKEMPPQEGMPPVSAEFGDRIMHVSLPISGNFSLFGCDNGGDWGPDFVAGNNISLSIKAESKEDASRLFKALSADGHVGMPMENTFWGAYFGMLTDKFGINWMINVDLNPENK